MSYYIGQNTDRSDRVSPTGFVEIESFNNKVLEMGENIWILSK